jgi:hypothetical protein
MKICLKDLGCESEGSMEMDLDSCAEAGFLFVVLKYRALLL